MAAPFHELKIAGIIQETPDSRSFVLEVPPALRRDFHYEAGQFLTFEIPYEGMRIRRCYSLCSAPVVDPWPTVTVKRVDEGRVSNWFNDTLKVGDTISVQPPEGRFVLAEGQSNGVVLFGGGSGITPLMSILKTALITTARRVKLVYANRDAQSVIFKDALDLWLAAYPDRLEVVHHLDSDDGFMTQKAIEKQLSGWEDASFYVCGPGPFMDCVEQAFNARSIDSARTKFERFVSPVDPDRREEPTESAPTDAGEVVSEFSMTLEGKTHLVPYTPGMSLLEAATKAGHKPPSSCEDGYCGCCMAKKKSGSVTMSQHEALTDDDLKNDWVLPCQARCNSTDPLEIDFDAPY